MIYYFILDNLNEDAELFQKQGAQLRRKYRNKNYKVNFNL